jgi:hypothetical protein
LKGIIADWQRNQKLVKNQRSSHNYYDTHLNAALNTPDINIPGRPGTESDISITKYGRSWSAFRMVCKTTRITNKYKR